MKVSLFDKTVEEAAEVLANRYTEVQIKRAADEATKAPSTAASPTATDKSDQGARAVIGGLAGAGIGGLGTLGYNYLKGKKTKLKDVLYGSLMGAVPGASLGYLTGSDGVKKEAPPPDSDTLAAVAGGFIPLGAGGLVAGASGPLGLNKIVGTSSLQRDLSARLQRAASDPRLSHQIDDLQKRLATALKDTSKNVLVNPINSRLTNINANKARIGAKLGLGGGTALLGYLHYLFGNK